MEIQEIGKMMYALRTEKRISQEELCRGICSVTTLSRLENGERRPDILVFNALFQRLGKSTDYIKIVLTLEEFEYFVKRRNIEIALLTKDFMQAERDLEKLEKELSVKGISVQRQDIYRLHGLFCIYREDYKMAETYVRKALLETMEELDRLRESSDYLLYGMWLSEAELQLLLLYVYIREEIGEAETLLLKNLLKYIRFKITDEKAQNKQLAQALNIQAYIYKRDCLWESCYQCCEQIIEAEVKNGTIAILFQALELEMECLEHGVWERNSELRRKEYACLREVIEEYGQESYRKNVIFFLDSLSQEKALIDEVIRFSRLREGYSQEKLSEGICSPETISRIEMGRNSPTVKKFYAIMNKLGLGIGYYNTEFVVEKYETLQKVEKLKYFSILRNCEEAEIVLKQIEKEVDIKKNQQQIGLYHVVFDYRLGRISLEQAMRKTEELLELTVKKVDGKYQIPFLLTSVEISLLNQVAVYYREMGKVERTIELLMLLYEYFHQSKMNPVEQSQKYFLVISNLAAFVEEINELEAALKFSDEALLSSIEYNSGIRLGKILTAKAYTKERVGDNSYKYDYRRGYYLSGLFKDFRNQEKVRKYMLENWKVTYEN